MTPEAYLNAMLAEQTLTGDSDEVADLRAERDRVEELLTDAFDESPQILYGGSYKKRTMIRAAFDLDVLVFFDSDVDWTIQQAYEEVEDVLGDEYLVQRTTSALRLLDPDSEYYEHVDVVPGKYVDSDDGEEYVWLHQNGWEKDRLKTDPKVHVQVIRDSDVRTAIKLLKFWREHERLDTKTFILELLVVKLLKDRADDSLPDQLLHFWEELRDNIENLTVKDPANEQGNDLSDLFDATVKAALSNAARRTLDTIENNGWEGVLGDVEEQEKGAPAILEDMASEAPGSGRPWADERPLV